MAEATDKKGILLQNLQDAGCNESMIQKCISYAEQGRSKEMLCLLRKYKPVLLEKIHIYQDELDCLDFMIYQCMKGIFNFETKNI